MTASRGPFLALPVLAFVLALIIVGVACGAGTTEVEPEPDPVADAGPGEVSTPPPDAQTVDVALTEWQVIPDISTVEAGEVYFLASNIGREPHEMLLVRSDLAPDQLPAEDGRVPEDEVDVVGEITPFVQGSEASVVFDLEPGNYVLLCNIVETQDGEIESHYENGMYAAFTVE